jgi:hypothetical protein
MWCDRRSAPTTIHAYTRKGRQPGHDGAGAPAFGAHNLGAYGTARKTGYGDRSRHVGFDNGFPALRLHGAWPPVLLTPVGVLQPSAAQTSYT